MPKEKEGFREQLARLDEYFPGTEKLTLAQAATILKKSSHTLRYNDRFPKRRDSKTAEWEVYKIPLALYMLREQ